jgi:hypothetical protein
LTPSEFVAQRQAMRAAEIVTGVLVPNCLAMGPTSHARGVYRRSVYLTGKLTGDHRQNGCCSMLLIC